MPECSYRASSLILNNGFPIKAFGNDIFKNSSFLKVTKKQGLNSLQTRLGYFDGIIEGEKIYFNQ